MFVSIPSLALKSINRKTKFKYMKFGEFIIHLTGDLDLWKYESGVEEGGFREIELLVYK